MRVRYVSHALITVCLLIPSIADVSAARHARADRVKVIVEWRDGRNERVPVTAASLGGEEVAEYASYRVMSFPRAAINGLAAKLSAKHLHATVRDDFDVLSLPGGTIDVRRGLDISIQPNALQRGYARGERGLHVVQFVGPITAEWMAAIENAGAKAIVAVQQNGQLVIAPPEAAAAIEKLAFVQWVSPYHPYHKGSAAKGFPGARTVDVEVADVEDSDAARQSLLRFDSSASETARYANRVTYRARLSGDAIETLLHDGLVMSITPVANVRISDERQVMSTTTNLDATGNQPTGPGSYMTWLGQRCGVLCTFLAADGFYVGIADSGLDTGSDGAATRHADLTNLQWGVHRMRFGSNFIAGTSNDDPLGHGTMVAGIIAGSGQSNAREPNGGYYLGIGMTPEGGVFSTKMISATQGADGQSNVFNWATDATNNNVFIQNHSHNTYLVDGAVNPGLLEGRYTATSAQYDAVVRDSNGAQWWGKPITLTVASGNREPSFTPGPWTLPPATAKNVIAVGGAENFRTAAYEINPPCRNTSAGGFKFISSFSKYGTAVPTTAGDGNSYSWSTYIKPDLTAPSSFISSTRGATTTNYCKTDFYGENEATEPGVDDYILDSGTSFAAPVAAGAAVMASRVYAQYTMLPPYSPSAASPAMIKAMLIAGARSMNGGTVRATGATIGPRPNAVQGFGLVNTAELFDFVPRSFFNQKHRFNSSSNPSWTTILTRRDSSKQVKAALTWTDAPAAANATEPLLNNLDLIVNTPTMGFTGPGQPLGPCNQTYWGNNPTQADTTFQIHCMMTFTGVGHDFRNNAELVVVPTGVDRTVVSVTVAPTQINAQADPAVSGNNQDFALYVYNATQPGDVDHDGLAEIFWYHTTSESTPTRAWTSPDGSGYYHLTGLLTQPWTIEATGDFDANGSDDVVIQHPSTGEVRIRLMSKHVPINSIVVATPGPFWEVAGAGDIDKDGHVDIILRNYGTGADSGKIRMWRMNNTSVYQTIDYPAVVADLGWRLEGVSDVNSDGHADLVWHHTANGNVLAWQMIGFLNNASVTLGNMPPGTWRIGAFGDYNQDGYNDIAWRNLSTGANVMWQIRNGAITTVSMGAEPDQNWRMAGPR